jgi:hypothetical protein
MLVEIKRNANTRTISATLPGLIELAPSPTLIFGRQEGRRLVALALAGWAAFTF